MELILAVLGSSSILGGIGWIIKARHERAVARELAYIAEIKDLQKEVKDLLQSRIRDEITRRESADQTMAVLKQLLEAHGTDGTQKVLAEILAILRNQGRTT